MTRAEDPRAGGHDAAESADVVVVGGGPAGSTFAAILKKYAPSLRVTILERDRHPRYHVGESTIPVINAVFHDLGITDRMYDGRFVLKMGVTYVWGRDRTPWDATYLEIERVDLGEGRELINVLGQDLSGVLAQESRREMPVSTVNVRRWEFDHMLLQHARDFGVDVREGTRARRVHTQADGAVAGVSWEDDRGRTGRIDAPFLLDASGLRSFMTRGTRINDPALANFAVNGYLRGAEWKALYRGTRKATNVLIASVDRGWIWYFPVGPDLMSVGAVTHTDHFKDRLREVDVEEFFWEMVRACPEVEPLVRRASLADDVIGSGRRVAAYRDWSSWAASPVGDGWAAAGDAAIFVDPILSTGVALAMQSAHRAAYTLNTAQRRPELGADELWRAYADYIRGEAGSFLQLARFFYGNNRAADGWWWQAHRAVNVAGHLALDPLRAFTLATAGFFPLPRAISPAIVAPLVEGASGSGADLKQVVRDDGVEDLEALRGARMRVLTPFRLGLRTEPRPDGTGTLDTFHDLVADDFDFAHRLAAAPCRIAPALRPVVDALPRYDAVDQLLRDAPRLLGGVSAPEDAVRQSTLAIIRNAVRKGFVQLDGGRPAGAPTEAAG